MKKSLLSILLLGASCAFAIDPLALAPFTFAGRIVDYAHIAYDAETSVEVRVESTNGVLLAKTSTATAGHTTYNYIVDVPVANQPMPGYVLPGTPVVIRFVDPDGKFFTGLPTVTPKGILPVVPAGEPASPVPGDDILAVGNPGEYRTVDIVLATDSDGDGVADEYVDMLAYLMWKNGIEEYNPSADYDGDGVSNYAEYVAGTNPFDATDRFSIREMAVAEGYDDYVAFKFLVNQGRAYKVETTEALDPAHVDWQDTDFKLDPEKDGQTILSTGPLETGYRTIFLLKEGVSRFWRLKSE